MKKTVIILTMCALAAGAFAIDLGVSVGGRYNPSTTTTTDNIIIVGETTVETAVASQGFAFGAQATFDFFQARIGFYEDTDLGGTRKTTTGSGSSETAIDPSKAGYSYLTLEALFRYPFRLGMLKAAATGGLEYDLCVGGTDSNGADYTADDINKAFGTDEGFGYFSKFFAKAGLSLDVPLAGSLSIRPWVDLGYGFLSSAETAAKADHTSYSLFDLAVSGGMAVVYRLR